MSSQFRAVIGSAIWTSALVTTYIYAYALEHPYYFLLYLVAFAFLAEKQHGKPKVGLEKLIFLTGIVLTVLGMSRAIEPIIDNLIRLLATNIVFITGATILFGLRVYSMFNIPSAEVAQDAAGV